jgi:hypothetical protein
MLALAAPPAAGNPDGSGCASSPSPAGSHAADADSRLRLAATWPWAADITTAITRLQAFPSG